MTVIGRGLGILPILRFRQHRYTCGALRAREQRSARVEHNANTSNPLMLQPKYRHYELTEEGDIEALLMCNRVLDLARRRLERLDLMRRFYGANYPAPPGFSEDHVRALLREDRLLRLPPGVAFLIHWKELKRNDALRKRKAKLLDQINEIVEREKRP